MSEQLTDLMGGSARWSAMSTEDASEASTASPEALTVRVKQGVIRDMGAYGQQVLSHASSLDVPESAPQGVMETLRNAVGGKSIDSTSSVEIIPGNPASRTSLRAAISMGYVKEVMPGIFENVHQSATEDQGQQQQEQPQADNLDLFDAPTEKAWADAIGPLDQAVYDNTVSKALAAATRGPEDAAAWSHVAQELAKSGGLEFDEAAGLLEQGHDFFATQVGEAFEKMGIDPDKVADVGEWIRTNRPDQFGHACRQLVAGRSLSEFKSLAVEWKLAHRPDDKVFRQAGFDVTLDRSTGDLMVRRGEGRWVRAADLGGGQ